MGLDQRFGTGHALGRKAKRIVEWAIYKAEEGGELSDGQVKFAAAVLHEEFPDVSQEEATSYARSLQIELERKQKKARVAKKAAERRKSERRLDVHPVQTELNSCMNCNSRVHPTAKICPQCGYPFNRQKFYNTQRCRGCSEMIPVVVPRKYSRSNQWDRVETCPLCGIKKPSNVKPPIELDFFAWCLVVLSVVLALIVLRILTSLG